MYILELLGFQGLLYVLLLVTFLVIRHMWKNAEVRKEEIIKLVDMTSQDDAFVEMKASVESSFAPSSIGHQCAACYSPTTMRCSKCKAVHYCSGKCQIIHWRQGHKDECSRPIIPASLKEESNSNSVAVSETPFDAYDFEGTHAGTASSNKSYSSFNPSVAESKSSDIDSRSRLANPTYHYTAEASSYTIGAAQTTSVPIDSSSLVNIENKRSSASKKNKTNSSHIADDTAVRSKLPRTMTDKSHDAVVNSVSHVHKRKVFTVEKTATDTSKGSPVSSMNYSSSEATADNAEEESYISRHKEVRKSPNGAHVLPLDTKGDLLLHTKSVKYENYHALPANGGGMQKLQQNVRNGLKTSVRKVVQQFKNSKDSASSLASAENEMGFPYEFFTKLYCCDNVELYPFGLTNCGNSCYANAVLQCLAYTRPLTSYFFHGLHPKKCQQKGWCFICEFECLIQKAKEGTNPLSPDGILSQIHKIGSCLGHGKEEDAHEFLRFAVETMQSICLKEARVSTPLAAETTLVRYTFGGYLRSKIKCSRCRGKSERYERMMDLTVEIDGDIGTLEDALRQFTAPEILEKDNKYYCGRCKSYEEAWKKLTVLEAPNILTIVLKRFQSGNFEKLNKSVQFPELLNLAPYMSGTKDKSPLYNLYAVVVHLNATNAAYSGHYVCYVKNFLEQWSRIDDNTVTPVELSTVLSVKAYMLFYARLSPKPLVLITSNAISSGKHKKRNLEAIHASKIRSNPLAGNTFHPTSQSKQGKHHHRNTAEGPLSNEFVDPEEWRFHYGKRNVLADSSCSESPLFSSPDASSCSTASSKDSGNTGDLSDYSFGEMAPNRDNHYGVSSHCANMSADNSVGSNDPCRRQRQDRRVRR